MTWNPLLRKWEGNDEAIREFDNVVTSSARPALISAYSATTSPVSSKKSTRLTPGLQGVRFVGNMVFDPARMAWFSATGEEEEEIDFGDDEVGESVAERNEKARIKPKASFLNGEAAIGAKPGDGHAGFWRACIEAERRHSEEMEPWSTWIENAPEEEKRDYLHDLRRVRASPCSSLGSLLSRMPRTDTDERTTRLAMTFLTKLVYTLCFSLAL